MDLSQLVSTYEGSKIPEFIRVIAYGNPGSGKTTLAASFPKPFFIDADRGLASVGFDVKCIVVDKTMLDPYGLICQVLEDAKLKRGIFAEGGMAYGTETIVLDSITTLGESMLAQLMRDNKKDPLTDKPGFDEWGVFQRRMIEIAGRIKDLSSRYNIVETAWCQVREDEDTKVVQAFPMLPGSYRQRAGGDMDDLWYLEARKGVDGLEVTLNAAPKGIYDAKTRVLGDLVIKNPTWALIKASMAKKKSQKKNLMNA